jgi:hypothetical protein
MDKVKVKPLEMSSDLVFQLADLRQCIKSRDCKVLNANE